MKPNKYFGYVTISYCVLKKTCFNKSVFESVFDKNIFKIITYKLFFKKYYK